MKVNIGEEEELQSGLVALVVTLVEILNQALQREAVRRMENEKLSNDEVDRLGQQLHQIEIEIERLRSEHDINDEVESLRTQINSLVDGAIEGIPQEGQDNE